MLRSWGEPPSMRVRVGIAAGMFELAVLASGLAAPNRTPSSVLLSVVSTPIFPIGLVFLVHTPGSGGASDLAALLACAVPYLVYSAVLALVLKSRSTGGFVLVCLLLAFVLALNVRGCAEAQHIRWMRS